MSVIELGLVTGGDDQPAAERGRRPVSRRERRGVLAAVMAVICVLTVTGSARPDPRGLPQLWSVPFQSAGDSFSTAGDTLFLLSARGGSRITAYDLRTGAERWSSTALPQLNWLGSVAEGALLLPSAYTSSNYTDVDGSMVSHEYSRDTVALDAGTGKRLWSQAGEFSATTGGQVLLADWNATGSKIRTLRLVRIEDGTLLWSLDAEGLQTWTTDGTVDAVADRLATVTGKGEIEVYDLTDGTRIATGTVPWGPASNPDNESNELTVEGRRLYLNNFRQDRTRITAYDTETMRQLWSIERPSSGGGVYGCGPVLCVSGLNETSGYDRDTGELRWHLDRNANTFPLGNGLLLVDEDDTGTRHHLIDGATGRRVTDLGAAAPVWNYSSGGTSYLLARTREPAGLVSVSQFDPRTGEVLLRGAIPPVLDSGCQNEGDLLVCVSLENQLTVTDVG